MIDIATVPIQGKDVLLQISDDNEVNWYTLVCGEKQGNTAARNIKQRDTQCGQIVGVGPSLKRDVTFDGVFNVVDDAIVDNLGYASGKKLKYWLNNATALIVRQINDDGSQFLNKSNAYLSDYKEDVPVDDVVSFSVTFAMWGTWSYTQ